MNDNTNTKVYEIDLSKKYILHFEDTPPDNARAEIMKLVDDWLKNDKPILTLWGNSVKLVKIRDDITEAT